MNKKQLVAEIKELKDDIKVWDQLVKSAKKEIKDGTKWGKECRAELKFRQKELKNKDFYPETK